MPPDTTHSEWHPLFDGDQAANIWRIIESIAEDLRVLSDNASSIVPPASWSIRPGHQASLGCGLAGVALFFSYLQRARPNEGHDQVALELLDRAIELVGERNVVPGLLDGFSGVAWSLEHAEGVVTEGEVGEAPADDVASAVSFCLKRQIWRGGHNLVSGLAGLGVYALERLPRPSALECLRLVVARLAETAEYRPEGIAWRAPKGRTRSCDSSSAAVFDLGIAHGISGIIAVLGAASAAGVDEARPLLSSAVEWLLAVKLPEGNGSVFPVQAVIPARQEGPELSPMDWCYGDLGIASALLTAARCVDNIFWEQEALKIGRVVVERVPSQENPADASLSHGAAGVGHLFNRLYALTALPEFGAASRAWFELAVGMRRPGVGFGGFEMAVNDVLGVTSRSDEPGLVTGAAGVGLALLAAVTTITPNWDRLLLLSVRDHNSFEGGTHACSSVRRAI